MPGPTAARVVTKRSTQNTQSCKLIGMSASGLVDQLEQLERHWGLDDDQCAEARRRLQRDAERMRLAERDDVLRAWLSVVDNMERALDAEWDDGDPLHVGVQAIHRQMLQVLEGFGVHRIPSLSAIPGDVMFDPTVHEAIATVDGGDTNLSDPVDGSIAEVVEPGYAVQDRVLRTAKVTTIRNSGEARGG